MESPSNPLLQVTDLRAVAAWPAHNVLTVADNTFATPVNQRPADFGIDLVWHSATNTSTAIRPWPGCAIPAWRPTRSMHWRPAR